MHQGNLRQSADSEANPTDIAQSLLIDKKVKIEISFFMLPVLLLPSSSRVRFKRNPVVSTSYRHIEPENTWVPNFVSYGRSDTIYA